MIWRILLPAVLPAWVISLRSGLGLGFMFVVAAEFMGASEGLGYLLVDGQQLGKADQFWRPSLHSPFWAKRPIAFSSSPRNPLSRGRTCPARGFEAGMLTIDRLSKTYVDGTEALRAISLTVPAGTISAVIGGSGCGKTTLLRLIAGLDRPSSGRILVDDETISGPHPAVGIVFQEPRLFPWLCVAGNTGFALRHLDAAERRARVEATLDRVGLADYAKRLPRELSGGQQQRVAIAAPAGRRNTCRGTSQDWRGVH